MYVLQPWLFFSLFMYSSSLIMFIYIFFRKFSSLPTIITSPVRLNETQLGAIGRQNVVALRAVTSEVAEIRISNRPLAIDLVRRYIDEGEENMMLAISSSSPRV
jgi:hypothetical protein